MRVIGMPKWRQCGGGILARGAHQLEEIKAENVEGIKLAIGDHQSLYNIIACGFGICVVNITRPGLHAIK